MNWWQWALLVIALYALVGLGCGLYFKSFKFGALWPLVILMALFGNVQ